MRTRARIAGALFPVAAATAVLAGGAPRGGGPASPATAPASVRAAFPALPVRFVENRGQFDPRLAYVAQGRGQVVGFAGAGVRFGFDGDAGRSAVDMEFRGARPGVAPIGARRTATEVNWFRGPREDWRTGVPAFGAVRYDDVWPGVDVEFVGAPGRVKYEFRVAAGADPSAIRLAWRGAASVGIGAAGQLVVEAAAAAFEDEPPVAWQERDGVRVPVEVAFALATEDGATVQRFELGGHDPSLPLVIDPAVVVYAGFLSGTSGEEGGNDIAVDAAGCAYVVGRTRFDAAYFPATRGPDATHNGGHNDAFVAKLTPAGDDLVYCGFLGGSGEDSAIALAVDADGCVYVTGRTTSTEASFPLAGGLDATANGMTDAFLVKLSPDGRDLVWSGFLGGADFDEANALALDSARNLYVAGATSSRETSFPVAVGPSLTFTVGEPATLADGFVAKVKADGSGLAYAGYVGGKGKEEAFGIAVDAAGAAYVTGYTVSDESSFPVRTGPRVVYGGGSGDAFVAKVAPDGASLAWCGYIGGAAHEVGYGVAVGADGAPWISGLTASPESSFPVAVGPSLEHSGDFDAFVAHVAADGASLVSCGYVGGAKFDASFGAALDGAGGLWIGGYAASNAAGDRFPVRVGPSLQHGGATDAFVARILLADASLASCGFLGGRGTEYSNGVAVDASGDVYVVGSTESDETTFPASVGPGLAVHGAGTSSFVAKVGAPAPATAAEGALVPDSVVVRRNAKVASRITLAVSGSLDLGAAPADLARGAVVTVGGTQVEIPAFARRGGRFEHAGEGLAVRVTPSRRGGSRAGFKLLARGDLADAVAPDGPLRLGFETAGARCRGDVRMRGGRFRRGWSRGGLVVPRMWLARAKARLGGPGRDALSIDAGFASPRGAPAAAPDVRIRFGAYSATFAGSRFTRAGDVFTFTGAAPGVTRLVVDLPREEVTLAASGVTLGAFANGPCPVEVAVSVGGDERAVRVRVVRSGGRLRY